jgi:hypothetical protein
MKYEIKHYSFVYSIFLFELSSRDADDEKFFYKNGIKKRYFSQQSSIGFAFQNIKKIIEGIDDEARLVVDGERLDEIKKTTK